VSGPIDVTFGESFCRHHAAITSNGSDDSVTLIDRDRIAEGRPGPADPSRPRDVPHDVAVEAR